MPDQLHKCVLKDHRGPASKTKEGKWCSWKILGTAALAPAARVSPEGYEHCVPVTGGGHIAGSFLSFMGVQSEH